MTKARELADLAGSSGGGIDVEAERLNQVIQSIPGAEGFDWSAGMAFDVVDEVPADNKGKVGDVVFIPGGPGGLPAGGGKILQVVRATDSTDRTTSSGTYVDVTGMSVTITPQKSTSAVLVVATFVGEVEDASGPSGLLYVQITDSSNNAVSGAEEGRQNVFATGASSVGSGQATVLMGYATPATTSATTYKLRFFQTSATTAKLRNSFCTGQMFALEISA